MRRIMSAMTVGIVAAAALTLAVGGADAGSKTAPFILHVLRYPGGFSGGVRNLVLNGRAAQPSAPPQPSAPTQLSGQGQFGPNQQINADSINSTQNETAVAVDLRNPLVAVAAAQQGQAAVMRTSDGGKTWSTTFVSATFEGSNCSCCDSALAYSVRDRAFYLGYLCIGFGGVSEIHLFKSVDGGATWTPPDKRALVISNHDYDSGFTDTSILNDKDEVVVDNTPTSPHYGRIYVTYIKFHSDVTGFSDYCPVQLAYTDQVPTPDPSQTVFTHVKVVPDNPGDDGIGPTANQHAHPVVATNGHLGVSYASEDCNSGIDRALAFKKSSDGGDTFGPTIQIDKPGQFVDNPDPSDLLPPTTFRAPLSPSLAISKTTNTLAYVYQNNVNRPQSSADIGISLSMDGGLTWSDAHVLSVTNTGAPAPNDQFFPWIDSDESGNFVAMWYDRRLDPGNKLIDEWQAVSTDDGRTWTTRKISTESWDSSRYGFIGDYIGLAASDAAIYPVWTDGRSAFFPGESDIWSNVEIRG